MFVNVALVLLDKLSYENYPTFGCLFEITTMKCRTFRHLQTTSTITNYKHANHWKGIKDQLAIHFTHHGREQCNIELDGDL